MPNNNRTLIGEKLKIIRRSLLLSRKTVSEITGIPTTTVARIESAAESYPDEKLDQLCAFYAYRKDDLNDESKPIPDWKRLKRKILSNYKPGSYEYISLTKKPEPKLAIEFRVLPTPFLNSYKKVRDVQNFLLKEYKWKYLSSSLTNALNSLVEQKLIESHPLSNSLFEYRKHSSVKPAAILSSNINFASLRDEIDKRNPDLVTRYGNYMTSIVLFLASGPKFRVEIMSNIGYSNLTKNFKNIVQPLLDAGYVSKTLPEKPTSSKQQYILIKKGRDLLREE